MVIQHMSKDLINEWAIGESDPLAMIPTAFLYSFCCFKVSSTQRQIHFIAISSVGLDFSFVRVLGVIVVLSLIFGESIVIVTILKIQQ